MKSESFKMRASFNGIILLLVLYCSSSLSYRISLHRTGNLQLSRASEVGKMVARNDIFTKESDEKYGVKRRVVNVLQHGSSLQRFGGRVVNMILALRSSLKTARKKIQKLLATLAVLISQMNLMNRLSLPQVIGSSATMTMIAPGKVLASPFVKYSQLQRNEKLATTPVFFLSNSGGSPYLQEDVQVTLFFGFNLNLYLLLCSHSSHCLLPFDLLHSLEK